MDQDLAGVDVAPLTDAEKLGPPASRVLAGHDAEPCYELPTLAEGSPVTDGSHDGGRHDRPDPGDLADAGRNDRGLSKTLISVRPKSSSSRQKSSFRRVSRTSRHRDNGLFELKLTGFY